MQQMIFIADFIACSTKTCSHVNVQVQGTIVLNKIYMVYSKKDRTFVIKTLFYNILSTVPFKVVPCTGGTPFPTFLPLLECFL